jgi:hypothetical protein
VRLALEVIHANNMKNTVELKAEIPLEHENQSAITVA